MNGLQQLLGIDSKQLRAHAAKLIIEDFEQKLFVMNSVESGLIMDSIIQLMPPELFSTLTYIIAEDSDDSIAQELIANMVFRVAAKLGLEFDDVEPVRRASALTWVIIQSENHRRKGNVEYSAPKDLFSDDPKDTGFNQLTEKGKELYHKQLLERADNKKGLVM